MQHEVVARAQSARGEVVVRRRAGDVLELRVNGVFVMDTAETSTERMLARTALTGVTEPRRVLVGGLGLGYTVRELLADSRVRGVVVAEIEELVVDWMRRGVLPGSDVLGDPRVDLVTSDVRRVVRASDSQAFDAILLDVDNGPGHLVHDSNADIYGRSFLTECRRVLRSHGRLTVWSADDSPDLADAVEAVFGGCRTEAVDVMLQGREEKYWLFTGEAVDEYLARGPIPSQP